MVRLGYLVAGFASLALGAIGLLLPLLPTVPFVILAAFCFARSSPALERRLVGHSTFGPHIEAWRSRGAISRRGKSAAALAFAASALIGLVVLSWPWSLVPLGAALIGGSWVLSRPD
ncbi:MAG TPA: YbaN family protein [Sphingomicrobium sp.]|jgi:uncharacterized protein|nr:YbaN family protein [Sphingomicrobium sp.]